MGKRRMEKIKGGKNLVINALRVETTPFNILT